MVSQLIGSTPPKHTRAVTLALRDVVKRNGLTPGEWVVACSGGPDSLALTFAVADLGGRMGAEVRAVIVDHGLRNESAEEAERTRLLLEKWKIAARVVPVSVGSEGGIEAAAREARYGALRENSGAGAVVFLGHTMDDQAESVLLGLGRGSGARSLSGMREVVREDAPSSRTWVRPLLGVRRWDTEGMCAELGLEPVQDPSNRLQGGWARADGGPLPRVAVRRRVIPSLGEALGRDVVPLLARSAQLLDADASALEEWAGRCWRPGEALVVEDLAGLPLAVRSRLLKDAAERAGAAHLTQAHVSALDRLVVGYEGGAPIDLPGGVKAWREREPELKREPERELREQQREPRANGRGEGKRDRTVRRLIKIMKTS
ncbi:MAG: tRNA lysidine(34) synthetase TilS [Actinomyces sp.]|uniref:tRNA lysidine(34) synthetase TilS n=1 Tax=Actinomyces sp. TaxID=29317 RepID=UPI001DC689A2|nr:tRNA lysidine(34) synthetase TilS [Actinomyces sp.]MBS5825612.1 tRNA lysidine(34) synthetase TilS [Actinomyces sp.]MBS6101184.1 tRNA lysidine(34) synthetase TilS [Actinomyces sp.]